MDPPLPENSTQAVEVNTPSTLTKEEKSKLLEELVNFRLSLPGHGRTSVGSTSLSTGVSIELISQIVDKAHTFTSPADMEENLPIFSQSHAVSIWEIVKQYIEKER